MIPSPESNNSSSESSVSIKKSVQKYLTNCKSIYSCIYCRTHLANHDELVSRSFRGNQGRAYLFNSVINISCKPAVQRELITGSHAVADIYCENCEKTLGWKYEKAYVESQKYKEGKYIIELAHVVRENKHLEFDRGEMLFSDKTRHHNNQHGQSSSEHLRNRSSTTSYSNEDVDELMFPFYDDIYTGRSSYHSSLSSSHHNRMRRSLYLDSTPYDWKYSTASSSASNKIQPGLAIASSLGSCDLTPSTSSSCDSYLEQHEQKSAYEQHIKSDNRNNDQKSAEAHNEFESDDSGEETQFNFEADHPDLSSQDLDEHCIHLPDANQRIGNAIKNVTQSVISDNINLSNSNSLSLEDEEFYDCYTGHDVSNSLATSDSTLRLY